ncbi:MAG: hypothetical protein AB9903_12430 [Vulcanimicrobiota bacterium]
MYLTSSHPFIERHYGFNDTRLSDMGQSQERSNLSFLLQLTERKTWGVCASAVDVKKDLTVR